MAMMMTGRVLLVCALCVLWCVAGGICEEHAKVVDDGAPGGGSVVLVKEKGVTETPMRSEQTGVLQVAEEAPNKGVADSSSEEEDEEEDGDDEPEGDINEEAEEITMEEGKGGKEEDKEHQSQSEGAAGHPVAAKGITGNSNQQTLHTPSSTEHNPSPDSLRLNIESPQNNLSKNNDAAKNQQTEGSRQGEEDNPKLNEGVAEPGPGKGNSGPEPGKQTEIHVPTGLSSASSGDAQETKHAVNGPPNASSGPVGGVTTGTHTDVKTGTEVHPPPPQEHHSPAVAAEKEGSIMEDVAIQRGGNERPQETLPEAATAAPPEGLRASAVRSSEKTDDVTDENEEIGEGNAEDETKKQQEQLQLPQQPQQSGEKGQQQQQQQQQEEQPHGYSTDDGEVPKKDKNALRTHATANTGDSDGSTAVSHTNSPLLPFLLVVACAAAAAVVAA
ncbi:mucin-associated surface protein [Trypanosoma cruzi cruzi]|nr:mucin-associated surface protein [Trypanosoma cruzi cruzi]